jgi:hypothetical protein
MAVYRGKVVAFDSGAWTATVRLDGSAGQSLDAIAVARNIASGEMTAGRRILLDTGDHSDPADFVITAIWGA